MIESDKLEYVIALTSGIFYSTGVSACILVLNNNKPDAHKDSVCLVDASKIYTAQRAQNIMTGQNVEEVYKLCSDYVDVIEKVKIASLTDIRSKDYSLSASGYIEKAARETVHPAIVRQHFLAELENVRVAEEKLKTLLADGGYLSE